MPITRIKDLKQGAPTTIDMDAKAAKLPKGDAVDGPSHYQGYDVLEFINKFNLGFELGNAVKYIARSKTKGSLIQDLKKAVFYINWYIDRFERLEVDGEEAD